MAKKSFWIELGFLPVSVAYVPTAKAWKRTLRKFDIELEPFPSSDGHCTWYQTKSHGNVILITVHPRSKHLTMTQVAGMITHECTHAWRHIKEIIGESQPSAEFEAYVMQRLVQDCLFAHRKLRRAPWSGV